MRRGSTLAACAWCRLAVNLIGGYLIGIAIAFFQGMPDLDPAWRLMVITGFLGTLTTFSSFSAETVNMLLNGRMGTALGQVALHLCGSLLLTARHPHEVPSPDRRVCQGRPMSAQCPWSSSSHSLHCQRAGGPVCRTRATASRRWQNWSRWAVRCRWPGSFPRISSGNVLREQYDWLHHRSACRLVFRLDGLSWLFCMLVLVIGALVVLYARYYMSPSDPVPRFFSFFLAFMGAMMGVVLSGNLVQMVFFWELTSLFSFLLIGYWHHRRDARRGARMALTVTGAGGLCLLAGVLVLGHIVGSYDLDVLLASGDEVRAHPRYTLVLVLVLLGAFTKSAQFPFHFWLPRAMAAPTPVSAYLHSATMVKLGVFLLARLWPVLSGTEPWFWLVGGSGAITLLLGGFAAMFQRDLKALLAYSTISHLGLITLLLGLNSPLAAVAAVFHVMNHATFKASLFMAAGIIDHETGTRDIGKLSGLIRLMPITGTLAIIASASMAGVPLLNGFLSKEMFFAEAVLVEAAPWVEWTLPVVATLASIFSVAYSARFVFDVFFGPPCGPAVPKTPHEPPHWMRVPVELLVLICLVVGIAPAWSVGPLLAAAARPVVGGELPEYSLAIWHGFNLPLAMSFVALAGGAVIYFMQRRLRARGWLVRTPLLHHFDGQRAFENLMARLSEAGRRGRRLLGTRRLQAQLLLLVLVAIAGGLASGVVHACCARRRRTAALLDHVRHDLDHWCGLRRGLCMAGQAPSPCLADARGRRGTDLLHHLHLVLGAGPGPDAARGGSGDHGADPARPALAADAQGDARSRQASDCGAGRAGAGATC